jgi:hypothetical protein
VEIHKLGAVELKGPFILTDNMTYILDLPHLGAETIAEEPNGWLTISRQAKKYSTLGYHRVLVIDNFTWILLDFSAHKVRYLHGPVTGVSVEGMTAREALAFLVWRAFEEEFPTNEEIAVFAVTQDSYNFEQIVDPNSSHWNGSERQFSEPQQSGLRRSSRRRPTGQARAVLVSTLHDIGTDTSDTSRSFTLGEEVTFSVIAMVKKGVYQVEDADGRRFFLKRANALEMTAYQKLHDIQGEGVPYCYGVWRCDESEYLLLEEIVNVLILSETSVGQMDPDTRVSLYKKAKRVLEECHVRGVVHFDISYSNILLRLKSDLSVDVVIIDYNASLMLVSPILK